MKIEKCTFILVIFSKVFRNILAMALRIPYIRPLKDDQSPGSWHAKSALPGEKDSLSDHRLRLPEADDAYWKNEPGSDVSARSPADTPHRYNYEIVPIPSNVSPLPFRSYN